MEGYQEELGSGRFVLERVSDEDTTLSLTMRGETGGVVKRVRVTTRIAPKALAYSLFVGDTIALIGQARTYVVPCLGPQRTCRSLGDIAVAKDVLFQRRTALNAFDGRRLTVGETIVADYELFGLSSAWADDRMPGVLPSLVVTGQRALAMGPDDRPLSDLSALRRTFPDVHIRGLRTDEAAMPAVDLDRYRGLAEENRANQPLNRAAGERMLDRTLTDKKDSYYTPDEFEKILSYIELRRRDREVLALRGVVYTEGLVNVSGTLQITDGALIVRGAVQIMEQAKLEVRRTKAGLALPGLVASGDGGMIRLAPGSAVTVDGVVLASVGVEVSSARLDVAGAILTGQGFVNDGGMVIVRYEPGVLGTIGLSRTDHVLIRRLSWQEVQ